VDGRGDASPDQARRRPDGGHQEAQEGELPGPQKEWLAEITYLGELHHQNLVSLVGYCCSDDVNTSKLLLVYEYMPRGSLENHLFRRGTQPLSWPMRVSIAVDVARGISFLHAQDNPVIFRDLKSSNVLLDAVRRRLLAVGLLA